MDGRGLRSYLRIADRRGPRILHRSLEKYNHGWLQKHFCVCRQLGQEIQNTRSGFGICRYNGETGELKLINNVFDGVIVGATCLESKRNILYCSHESTTLPGYFLGGGGLVYAFAIDPETGDLTEINHQPSYGSLVAFGQSVCSMRQG